MNGGADVPLVAEDTAAVVNRLDVLKVVYVVDTGLGEVIRMNDTTSAAQGVKFVAEVIYSLRGSVAKVRSDFRGVLPHLASFARDKRQTSTG